MDFSSFLSSPWFTYGFLPLLIFISRIMDVSIGTIRLIFVSKGFKNTAPILGFFEVLIWLLAIQQVMQNLDNVVCYIAYAGGFAAGTYIGIMLEERILIGKVMVRAVTKSDSSQLLKALQQSKFSATSTGARDSEGEVHLITCVTDKKKERELIDIIKQFNPNSFYSVEDVRYVDDAKTAFKKKKDIFAELLRKFK